MKPPLVFQNGQFLPASQLSIPVHDAGFVWGATVTDRVRTFNNKLFRLNEHLRRFRESCEIARVPLRESDEQLAAISERLIRERRHGGEASVVWVATPGSLLQLWTAAVADEPRPTLIAYTLPIDGARSNRALASGVSLASVPVPFGVDPRVKHRSRLAWWIALAEAHDRDPEAQPLFVNPASNHVLETPSSNVLAVIGGELVSPPVGSVLEGVSLAVVKEICQRLGQPFIRRDLPRSELHLASEILLTNTTDCVVGVSELDGQAVPFPGPIRNQLLGAWSALVGVDLQHSNT